MEVAEGHATIDDVDAFLDRLGTIGEEYDVAVQAFDARYVVDREHLERAVEFADRAIARDEAIARDRSVEILLYAAGTRQIDVALEMGVSAGERPVVVVIDGENEAGAAAAVTEDLEEAPVLGDYDEERVRAFFDIADAELAAADAPLPALVRERVALLVVER